MDSSIRGLLIGARLDGSADQGVVDSLACFDFTYSTRKHEVDLAVANLFVERHRGEKLPALGSS